MDWVAGHFTAVLLLLHPTSSLYFIAKLMSRHQEYPDRTFAPPGNVRSLATYSYPFSHPRTMNEKDWVAAAAMVMGGAEVLAVVSVPFAAVLGGLLAGRVRMSSAKPPRYGPLPYSQQAPW